MYKMDIRSVLYPLPNKNTALSWDLSVTCSSSQVLGLRQPVAVQSWSGPRAGAELCRCLSTGSKAAAACCALPDSSWLCLFLLGFIQLIPSAGVTAAVGDFEVNNALCLWSSDASISNQHRVRLSWLNVFVNAHISYYVLLIPLICSFCFFLFIFF